VRCFSVLEGAGAPLSEIIEAGAHACGTPIEALGFQRGEDAPELIVLAPGAALPRPCVCRCALVPDTANARALRALTADAAVSYGLSKRCSLTLSSLEPQRPVLALQREIATLTGIVLERQELPLRPWCNAGPEPLLAAAGTLLLLGVPPERLVSGTK